MTYALQAQYTLNGNALVVGDNCYRLTQQGTSFQNGSVWYTEPVDLSDDFEAQFLMNFGINDAQGADGMVFVFHQDGPNALGINGQGMGFQGFVPSLGIEFDTYENSDQGDLFADHIAVHRDGNVNHFAATNLNGPVAADNFDVNIEDGEDHVVTIKWTSITQLLQVYFDCELRVNFNYNIVQNIFSGNSIVTWGFTGATGALTNNQTVCLTENILGLDDSFQLCAGESVELSVNGPTNGTYAWSPPEGLSSTNTNTTTATPTETTTYQVNFTDFCGNAYFESTTVEVFDVPLLDLGPDFGLCEDQSFAFSILPEPDVDYVWEDGSDNLDRNLEPGNLYWLEASNNGCVFRDSLEIEAFNAPPNDVFQDISACESDPQLLEFDEPGISITWPDDTQGTTFEISENGNYTMVFRDDITNCEAENTIEVTFTPLPEIELGPDIEACENEVVEINAGGLAETYNWSTDDLGQSIFVNQSGSYSLTASNGNCESTDEIEVIIHPLPAIELGPDFSACENETVILSPESTGIQLEWQETQVSNTYEVSVSERINVVATDLATSCTNSDDIFVQILDNPILNLPLSVLACEGDVVVLENFELADSHSWSTGSNESSIEVLISGVYSIATSLGDCSNEASVDVLFNASPEYDLGEDFELCAGNSATLEVENNPTHDYYWNSVQGTNSFLSFESGVVQLTAIDTETGCIGSEEIEIFRIDVPIIDMPQYLPICQDMEVILEAEVSNADTYFWIEADGAQSLLVQEAGIYTLLAENQCGSNIAQTRTEIINCFCNSWVPNAFTPDGDGHNDFFIPIVDCDFYEFSFQIFNRWGELVFESDSPYNPWMGEHNEGSHFVQNDVYSWQMTYKSIIFDEVKTFNKSGHVLMLR